jgi:hypothetical protein
VVALKEHLAASNGIPDIEIVLPGEVEKTT